MEAGTWLRGSRAVRQDLPDLEDDDYRENGAIVNCNARHAVAALAILGRLLANLLDIVYQSDEKEKVRSSLYYLAGHPG